MKVFISSLIFLGSAMASVHPDFVSLSEVCPGISIVASYASTENFTGQIVPGYKAPKAYLAKVAAKALCEIQKEALKKGLGLRVFDAYRPAKAVSFFQIWAEKAETNPKLKETYYPRFTRLELFEKGYIAKQSSHSRGSAIDITLFDRKTGKDLDMGGIFDYFDDVSSTDYALITEKQRENRMLLKNLMETHGYKNFSQEWWHYSFRPEPYPEHAFDFDVE